jgi:hypothetical protein
MVAKKSKVMAHYHPSSPSVPEFLMVITFTVMSVMANWFDFRYADIVFIEPLLHLLQIAAAVVAIAVGVKTFKKKN